MIVELVTLAGIAAVSGAGLAWASKKFYVEVDPRVEKVNEVLPQVQCAACGYPGCMPFAEAVVKGEAPVTGCTVGGAPVSQKVAAIMGQEVAVTEERLVARLFCDGGCEEVKKRFAYDGIKDCKAAELVSEGEKACLYSCLGYGDCVRACTFDALYMNDNDLPVVIEDKCTGCELCLPACPRDLFKMIPEPMKVHVACLSEDKGPVVKKICSVGCIACDICVKACPFEAVVVENNLAIIDYGKCTNCTLCVPVCPTGIIKDLVEERPKAEIQAGCTGCTLCRDICPTEAISGTAGMLHTVAPEKCIGCGLCVDVCPEDVITMKSAEAAKPDDTRFIPIFGFVPTTNETREKAALAAAAK